MTLVIITTPNAFSDGGDDTTMFDVNASLATVFTAYDPFQVGWTAHTPDEFRALLRETLDAPTFNDSEVRRAAGI